MAIVDRPGHSVYIALLGAHRPLFDLQLVLKTAVGDDRFHLRFGEVRIPSPEYCTHGSVLSVSNDSSRLAVATSYGIIVCDVPSLEILAHCRFPSHRLRIMRCTLLIDLVILRLIFDLQSSDLIVVGIKAYAYLAKIMLPRVWIYRFSPRGHLIHAMPLFSRSVGYRCDASCSVDGEYVWVWNDHQGELCASSTGYTIGPPFGPLNHVYTLSDTIYGSRGAGFILRVTQNAIMAWKASSGRNVFSFTTDGGHTTEIMANRALLDGYFHESRQSSAAPRAFIQQRVWSRAYRFLLRGGRTTDVVLIIFSRTYAFVFLTIMHMATGPLLEHYGFDGAYFILAFCPFIVIVLLGKFWKRAVH